MKSALSLTLVVCVVGSPLPVTAREPSGSPANSITESIALEAIRLAAEPTAKPGGPDRASAHSDWSRIRKLQPGTEIVVIVTGASPATRYVLAADDSGMTLLNLTDPGLPRAARNALRDLNARNPELILASERGQVLLEGDVRLESGGVFVATQRVADRKQIVARIARTEVAEVKSPPRGRGAGTGAVVGAAVGAALGLGLASGLCDGSHCYASGYVRAAAWFGAGGLGIGALVGEMGHRPPTVIYRAP
jgi:hypothetical protein